LPKILGISGSPRIANTDRLVGVALEAAKEVQGTETELIRLRDYRIMHCDGCLGCMAGRCHIDDDMDELNKKLTDADAILIGAPTYWYNVPGILKDFMDRTVSIYYGQQRRRPWKKLLRDKVGAAITLSIIEGHEQVLSVISDFYELHEMVRLGGVALATQTYLDYDVKKTLGEVLTDDMLDQARMLGKSVAQFLTRKMKKT